MAEKLSEAELNGALEELSGWARVDCRDAIQPTYNFDAFEAALAFMTKVARKAE